MHSPEETVFEVVAGLVVGVLVGCLAAMIFVNSMPRVGVAGVVLGVGCGYAGRWIAWRYFSPREAYRKFSRFFGPVVTADPDTGEQCLLLDRICRVSGGKVAFCFGEAEDCFRVELEPAEIAEFIASQWSLYPPATQVESLTVTFWDAFSIDASTWWRSSRLGRRLRGNK
jgi:uncharacterized membrane protein YeaQ/YmgE (transglycosylase-associated protein family)